MNRIVSIELAGGTYPLNFSLKAAEAVTERYGDISKLGEAFQRKNMAEMVREVSWLLSLLMEQGAAFLKIMEGKEIKTFTADELEVVMGMLDLVEIKDKLLQAVTAGLHREVETESTGKNGETTQGR